MVAMIRMCWGQVSGERSTQASEVCYKWLFVKLLQQEILIVTIQLVNDVKKIAKQNSFIQNAGKVHRSSTELSLIVFNIEKVWSQSDYGATISFIMVETTS